MRYLVQCISHTSSWKQIETTTTQADTSMTKTQSLNGLFVVFVNAICFGAFPVAATVIYYLHVGIRDVDYVWRIQIQNFR